MTYKQIEASREIRQWIALGATVVMAMSTLDKSYPNIGNKAKQFGRNLKSKTINMFERKER